MSRITNESQCIQEKREKNQHQSQAKKQMIPAPWPHLDPDLVQSPKKTLQALDKRFEIRLRNIVTSPLQDNDLDITKILLIQLNMPRFQQSTSRRFPASHNTPTN